MSSALNNLERPRAQRAHLVAHAGPAEQESVAEEPRYRVSPEALP